eukprot:677455-Amphidinium_carterae.1
MNSSRKEIWTILHDPDVNRCARRSSNTKNLSCCPRQWSRCKIKRSLEIGCCGWGILSNAVDQSILGGRTFKKSLSQPTPSPQT